MILLAATALALGGCGRKGGLDLPPHASAQPPQTAAEAEEERESSKGTLFNPSYGADAPPAASKGSKKSFLLDPILGN